MLQWKHNASLEQPSQYASERTQLLMSMAGCSRPFLLPRPLFVQQGLQGHRLGGCPPQHLLYHRHPHWKQFMVTGVVLHNTLILLSSLLAGTDASAESKACSIDVSALSSSRIHSCQWCMLSDLASRFYELTNLHSKQSFEAAIAFIGNL